jgi:uncharacterized protein YyaL (SSP411 family)
MSRENRLAGEASAYLKSAAHQPVDWHPWGEEAFRQAQDQDKPILLDIGAVWCHWCHVMDGESYEEEETARLINENFIAVKVDRDERPDVDVRYQRAVSAISGQGGWPLTAFLTPEGDVFYGGTYFPPDDRFGRPGFKSVLTQVAGYYRDQRGSVMESAQRLGKVMDEAASVEAKPGDVTQELVNGGVDKMVQEFDAAHGGFGRAPKFPHPGALEILLRRASERRDSLALGVVVKTLEGMGKGGVYDQLGGGFHRYSTDERWCVPHFEKMAYDNAELLRVYVQAWQATGVAFFREVAEGIIRWVDEVASDPEAGGFYASQDADIDLHDDGDYFTWTVEELGEVLEGVDARIAAMHYNVYERGEMHHDPARNVLFVDFSAEDIAERLSLGQEEVSSRLVSGKRAMTEARAKRPTPFVDETIYVNWNGMMATAYLEASAALGREDCRRMALKTLERLWGEDFSDSEGFRHRAGGDGDSVTGLLDDQVQMGRALFSACQVTAEPLWLERAEAVMKVVLERFWDDEAGGLFDTATGGRALGGLRYRHKPIQDSPTPSANALAAQTLMRLHGVTGKLNYRHKAEGILKGFAEVIKDYGIYASTYFLAAEEFLNPGAHAVIVGPRSDTLTQELYQALLKAFRPGKLLTLVEPPEASSHPALPDQARSAASSYKGTPTAYVCAGMACAEPTSDPDQASLTLISFGVEGGGQPA